MLQIHPHNIKFINEQYQKCHSALDENISEVKKLNLQLISKNDLIKELKK